MRLFKLHNKPLQEIVLPHYQATIYHITFSRSLCMTVEHAEHVILACCVLHNFLRMHSTATYTPPNFADSIEPNGVIVDGAWRDDRTNIMNGVRPTNHRNPTQSAMEVRQNLTTFFDTVGRVSWQDNRVRRT